MSLETKIVDGKDGKSVGAKVSSLGQLVTAPLEFSTTYFNNMSVINTAFNFFVPVTNRRIVITDIIISADKNVGVNGALIDIYCASSAASTTIQDEILTVQLSTKTALPITGLNLVIPSGFWINGKTDDNNIFLTLGGYYVDNE